MKQSEINRLQMYVAVEGFLDQQAPVWNPVPIVSAYKLKLTGTILGIKTAAKDQEAAQVFIGKSLGELKRTVGTKLDILDDTLVAYAEDTGNPELISRASNSASDYYRLSHEEFETKAQNMIGLLSEHVADMGDYGMTMDQIEDAKMGIDGFLDKRGKPRAYQIASRVATQSLEDLFKEGTKAVGRLDNVLKRFKRSNPAFYNGYIAARTVVDN